MKWKFSILVLILIFLFILKIRVYDNPVTLLKIGQSSDRPSAKHGFILRRIYKISLNKDIGTELVNQLKGSKGDYWVGDYIRVLGVIGERKASTMLLDTIVNVTNDPQSDPGFLILDATKSIGLIGNTEAVPVLEHTIKPENIDWVNRSIAGALFLLTGKEYNYKSSNGNEEKYCPSEEAREARHIIKSGKKRTYEDMLTLDKIFQPQEM